MNLKPIAIPSACLLAGLLIGRLLPGSSQHGMAGDPGEPPVARTPPDTRPQQPHPDTQTRESNRPATPAAGAREAAGAAKGEITVPTSLISGLSQAVGARKLEQDLFSGDGMVEDALQITDREKAAIQTAWKASLQKIRDIETASMRSEEIDEWSVRITVPDLSSSMSQFGGDFRAKVNDALGENRSQAFLAAKQVDRMFSPPQGERSCTVTTEEIGDGQWRYRMTLADPNGNRVWVGASIPDDIRHLTDAAQIKPSL